MGDTLNTIVCGLGDNRFETPSHPYTIAVFEELAPRIMGPDGRCTCTQIQYCSLGRKGDQQRCTYTELKQFDSEVSCRRACQSGFGD